jgi:molecular chaperone GrpE (heat shock protein)
MHARVSEKALEDARSFAISNFAKDLLNVADNLN